MAIKERLTNIAIYSFTALMGAVWMLIALHFLYQGMQSYSWLETKAEVFVSRTERQKNMTYVPSIAYKYEVNGIEYRNSKVSYGDIGLPFFTSQSDVDQFRTAFQQGDTVTIYYDPSDPSYSCIIKGVRYIAYPIGAIVGLAFIAFGIRGIYKNII